jgi:hypothetical protein
MGFSLGSGRIRNKRAVRSGSKREWNVLRKCFHRMRTIRGTCMLVEIDLPWLKGGFKASKQRHERCGLDIYTRPWLRLIEHEYWYRLWIVIVASRRTQRTQMSFVSQTPKLYVYTQVDPVPKYRYDVIEMWTPNLLFAIGHSLIIYVYATEHLRSSRAPFWSQTETTVRHKHTHISQQAACCISINICTWFAYMRPFCTCLFGPLVLLWAVAQFYFPSVRIRKDWGMLFFLSTCMYAHSYLV